MAEGVPLLRVYIRNGIEGSNPSFSAINKKGPIGAFFINLRSRRNWKVKRFEPESAKQAETMTVFKKSALKGFIQISPTAEFGPPIGAPTG